MTELDAAQAYLNKKFPGYTLIPEDEFSKGAFIPKKNVDSVVKYLSNEIKGKKLSQCKSEECNHIARISAARLIISLLELRTDEEISATIDKANIRLTTEEELLEKALIACRDYLAVSRDSPEAMLEELKAELLEE